MANRLAQETSPYLRQHKENPVDWYPWGTEAFEKAKADDKPILLSVGYSACHWCHVMAHESFEDSATAAVMNELFVNVKVDREERPDVDAVYMEAVQALVGRGGWPMTVFLTPDRTPFHGGTYFPNRARGGMPAFTDVCRAVAQAWQERREGVVDQAAKLAEMLGQASELRPSTDALPGAEALEAARRALAARFDARWGGFGSAPKFPQPDVLEVLLQHHAHHGEEYTLAMVTTTLDAMASGGIYDHLGGGFARYSVDERWLVPHFEKMLYDQALLARSYLHAWQITGEPRYLQVLSETIDYVLRDLSHPAGGFFSSEDADSEGVEGRFYVWDSEELRRCLGDLAPAAESWWGVTDHGNFEGANILHRPVRGDLARPAEIETARARLLAARSRRVRPGLDDKVLTEWNAMFLSALAEAAAATGRADWLAAARANADFLLGSLRRMDGRWLRSWQGGRPGRPMAYAADLAALVDAFTRLGEATGQARWISDARGVADQLIAQFWDDQAGGVFTTGHDAESLITRAKDIIDQAVPSANGTAAVALLRLSALTGQPDYRNRAEAILRLLGDPVSRHPTAFCRLLAAIDLASAGITEIVITGNRPDLVAATHGRYLPNAVVAWGEPYESPLFENRLGETSDSGMAYVCRDYVCQLPTAEVEILLAQLSQ